MPAIRLKWKTRTQPPATLWYMYIGPDAGCQEVPEPIWPIDMMLVSFEPTLMPMSSPFITINEP